MKCCLCGVTANDIKGEAVEQKLFKAFGVSEHWRLLPTEEIARLVEAAEENNFDTPSLRKAKEFLRGYRTTKLIDSFRDSGMEKLWSLLSPCFALIRVAAAFRRGSRRRNNHENHENNRSHPPSMDSDRSKDQMVALGACKEGNIEALKGLHENAETTDLLNARNKGGQGCAHLAAMDGNVDVLQALDDMGRSNLFTIEDKENLTPVHYAVINGHRNCLLWLGRKGVPLETKDKYGRTPLHIAAQEGRVDMIPVFQQLGVDFQLRTHRGKTAAHYASKFGRIDFLRALVEMEFRLDVIDNDARGLLYEAAKHNHPVIIELLVENGLSCISKDNDQSTAAHFAATEGHLECIRMLQRVGGTECLCIPNKTGRTPLHVAAQSGFAQIISAFKDFGIDPRVYDVGRNSPAHLAAQNGHLNAIKVLFEMGPMDEKNKYGRTPGHLAAWRNKSEILAFLGLNGVDVLTCQDNDGNLPIDLAKEESSMNDTVKTLEWIARKTNSLNTPQNGESVTTNANVSPRP